MSCLSVTLTRVGGIKASTSRVGGDIDVKMHLVNDLSVSLARVGGMSVNLTRIGGKAMIRLVQICRTDIRKPYLTISPEIIWVYPEFAVDNDVYSNLKWNVK